MSHDQHEHDHSVAGETHGIALGFRIFEHEGELYFAEAEIAAYVDDPEVLGATLVFHRVSGIDPTVTTDELELPTWAIDIDEELSRDEAEPVTRQFEAILRQLSGLPESELRQYLERATEAGD
jgi:hypothetical protein